MVSSDRNIRQINIFSVSVFREMFLFSTACKTIHASPSSREHPYDSAGLSQSGCLTPDHRHMLGTELGLMEMTEVEYMHLQHLIQVHMEAQAGPPDGSDNRSDPATGMVKDTTGSTVISTLTTTQAIDLSTSTDEHGEKTPASYGDVPGFVLAKIRGEDSPTSNSSTSSQKRSRSAARVCLEKRFNTMTADVPRPQDLQSAVLNK